MKKFTRELGPGWITLVENDDYALCRLIFGDGLEVDADEEETPLLKKGFQQIMEYWTGHRVIFTLPLAPGGSDFEREVWETVIHIPYGEHFTTPTLLAALSLEDTEENRTRVPRVAAPAGRQPSPAAPRRLTCSISGRSPDTDRRRRQASHRPAAAPADRQASCPKRPPASWSGNGCPPS